MSGAVSMNAFLGDPGAWAQPRLMARLIAPGLSADVAGRLVAAPRTGARASALLATMLGEGDPGQLQPADSRLVLASPETLVSLCHASGAVCHARRVRALVRGAEISAFATRFGQAARDMALAHEAPFVTRSTGQLENDVARDAASCLAAFVLSLPPWAASRLRLVHDAPDEVPDDMPARAALLRRLAGLVLT